MSTGTTAALPRVPSKPSNAQKEIERAMDAVPSKVVQKLTREILLQRARRPARIEKVKDVSFDVWVSSLSHGDRETFIKQNRTPNEDGSFTASEDSEVKLALLTICDENGVRLLSDDDAEALKEFDWNDLVKIILHAGIINGFGDRAWQEAKNASAGQTVPAFDSNTVSQDTSVSS